MNTVGFRQLEDRFPLTTEALENTVFTLPASDLLEADNIVRLLDTYGPLIKARDRSVAAAFFVSWYAGVCSAVQHMLFRGNALVWDLSLSNLTIQLYAGDTFPLFSFKVNEMRSNPISILDRDVWCKQFLDLFYREQVTPLIRILSEQVHMNVMPLWGQIINAIYAQLEDELAEAPDEASRERIRDHFKTFTQGIEASAFGLRKNPFDRKQRSIEHPTNPGHQIAMKNACCLAYCLDADFGYCYECPRLSETDRLGMRMNSKS
ncbi:hypothetical protein EBB07_18700 [Paenibacillaceae bacterium]|nr:hypothetical protein EBB07_18700 [Paenibacillaceae bacterium]